MTTLKELEEDEFDITKTREYLRENNYDALLWSITDVSEGHPYLTDEQCMDVIESFCDNHDSSNEYYELEMLATDMFPLTAEARAAWIATLMADPAFDIDKSQFDFTDEEQAAIEAAHEKSE